MLEAVRSAEVPDLHGIAPDAMAAAVSAAMSKDPARPETAGSLAAALTGSATLVMATAPVARRSIGIGGANCRHGPPTAAREAGTASSQTPVSLASPPIAGGCGSRGRRDDERPPGEDADQEATATTTAVPATTTPLTAPTTTIAPTRRLSRPPQRPRPW